MSNGSSLQFNGVVVAPGTNVYIDIPVTQLYTHAPVTIPVHVIHSKRPGPRLFVSGAVHGDEINGVEIIRRILKLPALKRLRGTLIAVPIVNVHGFINHSRYLPDRRDLNRSFPGSETGSLTARVANIFERVIQINAKGQAQAHPYDPQANQHDHSNSQYPGYSFSSDIQQITLFYNCQMP